MVAPPSSLLAAWRPQLLKTPLCDLFGIEVPIILAPMGTCTSAELAAAVTMTLVPQVVDAVSPMPVVAAGGIFDGRGIAAAVMLGAVGVNLGTRFIASTEAPAPDGWKQAITAAESEDAIKVDVLNDISPLPGTVGFQTVLRSLHTTFIDEWSAKREAARRDRDSLREQIVSTTQSGRPHACLLTAGQTAGGIKQVLSVGDIMRGLVAETKAALSRAPALAAALQSGRAA